LTTAPVRAQPQRLFRVFLRIPAAQFLPDLGQNCAAGICMCAEQKNSVLRIRRSGLTLRDMPAITFNPEPAPFRFTVADLARLTPIYNVESRDGSWYYELHPRERPEGEECWISGSMLIHETAFTFFTKLFYAANPDFNEYAFVRFDEIHIARLVGELQGFVNTLYARPTRKQALSGHMSSHTHAHWAAVPEAALVAAVLECAQAMRKFIDERTRISHCLWVLGM
jgi:hypothetical protein